MQKRDKISLWRKKMGDTALSSHKNPVILKTFAYILKSHIQKDKK